MKIEREEELSARDELENENEEGSWKWNWESEIVSTSFS